MTSASLSVLVLAGRMGAATNIRELLASRGLAYSFAVSANEALGVFGHGNFDLILIVNVLPKEIPEPLLYSLGTAEVSAFLCYPVEVGCWWLPILLNGSRCFGAPGLRECDFIEMVDLLLCHSPAPRAAATSA